MPELKWHQSGLKKHLACNVYETKSLRAPKTQLSDKFPFWIVSIFECTQIHIQAALKTEGGHMAFPPLPSIY